MAEIHFEDEWFERMVQFASVNPRIARTVKWLLANEGSDVEIPYLLANECSDVCLNFGLNPTEDLVDVLEACEEKITGGTINDQA